MPNAQRRTLRMPLALGTALVLSLLVGVPGLSQRAEAGWMSSVRILEDPGSDGFGMAFNGVFSPYPFMTTCVMPGDSLRVEAAGEQDGAVLTADADAGRLEPVSARAWVWRAPSDPGYARITVHNSSTGERRTLQIFVLVPYHGETVLNGFPIGRYEVQPLDDDPAYTRPAGFIEVTRENENTWVSPHFQLKQFLCKQKGDYPKYLALQTPLLIKLERLHDDLTRRDRVDAVIHVMSGYRTPKYNRSIGNRTKYSRHLYGDAADVFIDDDGDDLMDDWNGDGAISVEDAAALYARLEGLHPLPWFPDFLGGLGLYGPGQGRGPFVHIDLRGSHARWGDRKGKAWLTARGVLEDEEAGSRRNSSELPADREPPTDTRTRTRR